MRRIRARMAFGLGSYGRHIPLGSPTVSSAVIPPAALTVAAAVTTPLRFQAQQHPAGTTYQCSNCGKAFRLLNALNHHIMTKHAGEAKVVAVGADGKPIVEAAPKAQTASPTPPPPSTLAASSAPAAAKPAPTEAPPKVMTDTSTIAADEAAAVTGGVGDSQKVFTCTICEKQFRLEAALIHHYQAKHNMEPPQAATKPKEDTDAIKSTANGVDDKVGAATPVKQPEAPVARGHSYIPASETMAPQPPQYHLDVAPNAPEEIEIAAHHRCVNHMLVVGAAQDVQQGYVFEDHVTQFIVVTDFDGAAPGEADRDFHTVRVYGEKNAQAVKSLLDGGIAGTGKRVLVSGRLRIVPQFESKTSKYYHFPVLQVQEGSGFVQVLDV